MTLNTIKSQADLDNEALDAAMTDADRRYWHEAGEAELRIARMNKSDAPRRKVRRRK